MTPSALACYLETLALAIRRDKVLTPPETRPGKSTLAGHTFPRPTCDAHGLRFLAGAFPDAIRSEATPSRLPVVEAECIHLRQLVTTANNRADSLSRELAEARQELASFRRVPRPTVRLSDLIADAQEARPAVPVANVAAQIVAALPKPATITSVRLSFPPSEQSHILREAGVTLDELRGAYRWHFTDRANPKAGGWWQGTAGPKEASEIIGSRLATHGATVSHV